MDKGNCIISINDDSSSIKFSLYKIKGSLEQLLHGEIDNIRSKRAKLNFSTVDNEY